MQSGRRGIQASSQALKMSAAVTVNAPDGTLRSSSRAHTAQMGVSVTPGSAAALRSRTRTSADASSLRPHVASPRSTGVRERPARPTASISTELSVFHLFKVALTANPTRRDAAGLTAFRQSCPHVQIGKAAILCATERAFWITDDVAGLPWNRI